MGLVGLSVGLWGGLWAYGACRGYLWAMGLVGASCGLWGLSVGLWGGLSGYGACRAICGLMGLVGVGVGYGACRGYL